MKNESVRSRLEQLQELGWTIPDLIKLLKEMEAVTNYIEEQGVSVEAKVREILKKLGVPTSVQGYHYLTKAVLYYIEDRTVIKSLSKILCMKIAEEYKESPKRIEEAIRTSIELTWQRGNIDLIDELFGNTVSDKRGKPNTKTFITIIGEEVKKQRNIT